MASTEKNWSSAKAYILDPLTAPEPADETGPGSSLIPQQVRQNGAVTPPRSRANGRHGSPKAGRATTRELPPSPPYSASPQRSPPAHRREAFNDQGHRRRSSSLGERFPGDMSHRPLDQLTKEKAVANKSRHITKKHHIRPDGVDRLDDAAAGGAYHHGGPYDATLFARNNSYESSPVKAVSSGNEEAIRATPKERIEDSLQGHRPLDGVAAYPPGQTDPNGHTYQYEEGDNMMLYGNPAGGAYKRIPGVEYHPDDIKGKGEPSYSLEKALKKGEHNDTNEVEMTTRSTGNSLSQALRKEGYQSEDDQVRRSGSFSKRLSGGLKKRIGSIKKSARHDD